MTGPHTNCWSCAAPRVSEAPLCPACGKVQPVPPNQVGVTRVVDKFAVLGLARSFELTEAQLSEKFLALSRKLHPDRFARASAAERRFALEQTTRLNDANRTLREPARRAEHLLELRGIHLAGDEPQGGRGLPIAQPLRMSPAFLEEMMEEREKLMDARLDGGPEAVAALAEAMKRKRAETMALVGQMLGALDEPGGPAPAAVAEQIAKLRYQDRYLDDALGRGAEI